MRCRLPHSESVTDHDDKHRGPAHASPYGLSRLAPSISLVDVASEIAEADQMLGAVAGSKLSVIAEQIRQLQQSARRVLEDTRRDLELHRAECRFQRRPGQVYHLYRRSNGALSWSMITPNEWGAHPPYEFTGSYRLELDRSWTRVDGMDDDGPRDSAIDAEAVVRHVLTNT